MLLEEKDSGLEYSPIQYHPVDKMSVEGYKRLTGWGTEFADGESALEWEGYYSSKAERLLMESDLSSLESSPKPVELREERLSKWADLSSLEGFPKPVVEQPVQKQAELPLQDERDRLTKAEVAAGSEVRITKGMTGDLPNISALKDKRETLEGFRTLVHAVEFLEIAVPNSERAIAHPEKFSFVPVVSQRPSHKSFDSAGDLVDIDEGIRTSYQYSDGRPYLDTRQAIGLVYGDHLIAVAGAGLTDEEELKITQIQDVSGVRKSAGRAFYKTGLHNGFNWRDALVGAWEEIGTTIGVEKIVVQSNRNNGWRKVRDAGTRGYDDVADRLGYKFDEKSKNWVKQLHEPQRGIGKGVVRALKRLRMRS